MRSSRWIKIDSAIYGSRMEAQEMNERYWQYWEWTGTALENPLIGKGYIAWRARNTTESSIREFLSRKGYSYIMHDKRGGRKKITLDEVSKFKPKKRILLKTKRRKKRKKVKAKYYRIKIHHVKKKKRTDPPWLKKRIARGENRRVILEKDIRRFYLGGYSGKEIAKMLALKLPQVYYYLRKTRRR